jgi:hypothetical protein
MGGRSCGLEVRWLSVNLHTATTPILTNGDHTV